MLIEKHWSQIVPGSIEKVWVFFSSPKNLNLLTPSDMQFEIITDVESVSMYAGQLIQYNISPFAGIKMPWVTEITQVKHQTYFIDEQRFGPYAFWHHQHHFEECEEGILMTDHLHYKLPMGFLGKLFAGNFVSQKIERIFDYRQQAVDNYFKS